MRSRRRSSIEPGGDRVERALQVARAAGRIRQSNGPLLTARQQDRRVAGRGELTALGGGRQLDVARGPLAVREVATGHTTAQPLCVADVVELAELAVELPEP